LPWFGRARPLNILFTIAANLTRAAVWLEDVRAMGLRKTCTRRQILALAAGLSAALTVPGIGSARAESAMDEFMGRLNATQRQQFQGWRAARRAHDAQLDSYWQVVEAKRAERRKKKAASVALLANDYVQTFPPVYGGPQLPPDLLKSWTKFNEEQDARQPAPPPKEIASLEDFLAAANGVYGFVPERVSERTFKDRYAEEALALGLTKTQVVRIYALETGGQGTADMQSGVNPITKRGKPISSALGYAQLLDANSVSELAKHGRKFITRLEQMAARSDQPRERAAQLRTKAEILGRMWDDSKSVPNVWAQHQVFAKTAKGQGIHAINLDGDIGPMLQAVKLLGLKDEAERAGKGRLAGAEMELMNLAGPGTGLEILLHPAAAAAPTTNFFARRAYGVNKMAQNLTGAGLLAELDRRMDSDIKKPGSVEFEAAFDGVAASKLPWQ
jgi:hypothetical protein